MTLADVPLQRLCVREFVCVSKVVILASHAKRSTHAYTHRLHPP